MDRDRMSAVVVTFPQPPETALRRALARLDTALMAQAAAARQLRQQVGELRAAVGSLDANLVACDASLRGMLGLLGRGAAPCIR